MKIEAEITSIAGLVAYTMFRKGQGTREAGRNLGVSAATVSRIARGGNFSVSDGFLPRLARWAEATPDQIFDLMETT